MAAKRYLKLWISCSSLISGTRPFVGRYGNDGGRARPVRSLVFWRSLGRRILSVVLIRYLVAAYYYLIMAGDTASVPVGVEFRRVSSLASRAARQCPVVGWRCPARGRAQSAKQHCCCSWFRIGI